MFLCCDVIKLIYGLAYTLIGSNNFVNVIVAFFYQIITNYTK